MELFGRIFPKIFPNVVEIVVEKNKPIENQWVIVLKCGIGGSRTPVRLCDSKRFLHV